MAHYVLQIKRYTQPEETYDVSLYEDGRFYSDGYTALVDARNRAKEEGNEVRFRMATVFEDNGREREESVRKGKITADGKLVTDKGHEIRLEEARASVRPMGRRKPKKASHLLVISFDKDGARSDELFSLKDGKKEKLEVPESRTEIDYAFDIASNGGRVEYEIRSEGLPTEYGMISKEGEMFSKPVAEAKSETPNGPDRG